MEGKKLKILVADGDHFLAEIFRAKFQQSDCEAEVAVRFEEAVEKLKSGGFDIVMTEIDLPGSERFALVDHVNSMGEGRPKCVVLSRSGEKEDIDRAGESGADAYLIKTQSTFKEVLSELYMVASR